MKRLEFRALVIDDDAKMQNAVVQRLGGLRVSVGSREMTPVIDQLLVEIEVGENGQRGFSERTLYALLALGRVTYDYIILDYSYAAPEKQIVQWNEGSGHVEPSDSNSHLLMVADLKKSAEEFSARLGSDASLRVREFFSTRARILLRSFQHDRKHDILGSFEHREQVTRSTFPNVRQIDSLNSFALIYDSDATLRDELYHNSRRGRELYRNVATTLVGRYFESAMSQRLAAHSSRFLVPRHSAYIALLTISIAALSSFVQALIEPLVALAADRDWATFFSIAILAIFGLAAGSVTVAAIAEHGVGKVLGSTKQGADS